uniref:Uncharacterized protein n=1 Tax=Romanomermis culicivorax TaxID=13658 RepID=A0A915J0M9_ROMCU
MKTPKKAACTNNSYLKDFQIVCRFFEDTRRFFEAVFAIAITNDDAITTINVVTTMTSATSIFATSGMTTLINPHYFQSNLAQNAVSDALHLPMQARPSSAHSVTSASDAAHQNMGAHLRNYFPQGAPMSALSAHHQNILQQGASMSAVGAHHQNIFSQGASTSTMDAHHQNDFLQ